jgi:PKD repeat protein
MKKAPVFFFLAFILLTGCSKTAKPPAATYDFSYSGTLYTYETVTFQSTAQGKKLLWNFGDGSTSSDSVPTHTYRTSGTYAVMLIVNGDPEHSITKPVSILPTTGRMALSGLYNTASEFDQLKYWPIDHSVYLYTNGWPPAKFVISPTSDSTLIVTDSFTVTYKFTESYVKIDSLCNDTMLVFTSHKYPFLLYDHKNDRILFDLVFNGDPGPGYMIRSYKLR